MEWIIPLAIDDVTTWRDLLEWAWSGIQEASPWLAPLLWSALFIALIVLWVKGKGWQKVKAVVAWMQKAVRGVDQIIKLADDMAYVKAQLEHNGGSTVKDAVHRLERIAARIEKKTQSTQKLLDEHIKNTTT